MISPRKWERLLTTACDVAMREGAFHTAVHGEGARYIFSEKALGKIESLDIYNERRPQGKLADRAVEILKRNLTVDAIAWRIEAMYLARHTMTHLF